MASNFSFVVVLNEAAIRCFQIDNRDYPANERFEL
jgi:hypothetical protein